MTVAAVALAYQITLPQIDAFFQFYGDGTGKYDYAANAVILATVLIVFTTVINAIGVKLMSRINSTGVFIELVAAVLLIIALLVNVTRGPGVVFDTQGLGASWDLGYLGAFLAASLASAYVMYGFDTASSLGEESLDPRKNAPRAILRGARRLVLHRRRDPPVRDDGGRPTSTARRSASAACSSSSSTSSATRSATSSCGRW